MKFYFISGIPGSGKSTASRALAKELDIYHTLSTDVIRSIVQRYHNEDEFPVMFESSYNAHKHAPLQTEKPNLWGFKEQAKLMKPGIKGLFKRFIKEGQDLILEGVHLIPGYYHVPKEVDFHHIVIQLSDKEKYKQQILGQGEERSKEKINAVESCWEFQDYLVQQAQEYNEFHKKTLGINPRHSRPVTIIENNGTIDDLIKKILTSTQNLPNSKLKARGINND